MTFVGLGIAVAALGFLAANGALSLLTFLLWRVFRVRPRGAGGLLALRLLPAAGSMLLAMVVVLPGYWLFEPRDTQERVAPVLAAFFVPALVLVAACGARGLMSWRKTRRLASSWMAAVVDGPPLSRSIPAYRIRCDAPFAALVGVFRPRLFVSDRLLSVLSPEERRMVMAHEEGHWRSSDNLKRTVMSLAPDGLAFTAVGREIEAAWSMASEEAADDHAARADAAGPVDLASALIKALRLTPLRCEPATNFCDGATIARRVRRLLDDPEIGPAERPFRSHVVWVLSGVAAAAAIVSPPVLRAVHAIAEGAVRLLQ